jgi:hypothetical protein
MVELRHVELQLLLHTASSSEAHTSPPGDLPDQAAANAALQRIVSGDFISALSTTGALDLLSVDSSADASDAPAYYAFVRERLREQMRVAIQKGDDATLGAMLLAGVSSLCIFVQHNLTG